MALFAYFVFPAGFKKAQHKINLALFIMILGDLLVPASSNRYIYIYII